jgi:integrase/recombinase XerD
MNQNKIWRAEIIKRRGVQYIAIWIAKDPVLTDRIRKLEGIRWNPGEAAWLLPDTPGNRDRFGLPREVVLSIWHQQGIIKLERHIRTLRYSENTVKSYTDALRVFLKFHNTKQASELTEQDIIAFHHDYIIRNKLSISWQNQAINAIKHYLHIVDNRRVEVELLRRPKREKKLPNVLSKEEVKTILESLHNVKHRLMLILIYACGLRRSEVLGLKLTDLDSDRGVLVIRQSKGKKDRIVPLSPKLFELAREYYKQYKPEKWLFEGQTKGSPYDERSLASVFRKALEAGKIRKPATLHWLRHSYATHLLESGTDLRYIQELLGHRSSRTTEIYTHVSIRSIQQIRSPFDDL